MIEINITVLIQLVNFLVALVVINYLLIRPIRNVIRERREAMDGLGHEIDGFSNEAETRLSAYEAALASARDDANTRRKQAKVAAETEEKAILASATKEAQTKMQAQQAAVQAEANAAYAALKEQVPAYADAALARLLA